MKHKISKLFGNGWTGLLFTSVIIALITFLQLQLSVSHIPVIKQGMSLISMLWNISTIWLALVFLMLIFKRKLIVAMVWNILMSVIAYANYYVLLYHGAPLTFDSLKNFATAMDVVGSYKLTLNVYSGCIIVCFLMNLAICYFARRFSRNTGAESEDISLTKRIGVGGLAVVLLACNIYGGIFSEYAFKPANSITFSWQSSAGKYGFLALQLESHFQQGEAILSFENYSKEDIQREYNRLISQKTETEKSELPDIVVILNESFYDLNKITDTETNISPLENYYAMENVVRGCSVVPSECGGTNRTEFELLTSVSNCFFPVKTPFWGVDMAQRNSIVSFLKDFGYETYGAHCGKAQNYNRSYSYPAMGFDHSYFDVNFEGLERYGNRHHTDESAYKNLIKWYEEPVDKPKFMYLLTYQNHGSWEQNSKELDTVQTGKDFGEYTEQIDEYLSSLRLSDIALGNLLEYFENVDRPVIVCMLGDHAPSFANKIADKSIPEDEMRYLIRSTPFVIWSNYGLQSEDMGYVSVNYIVPKILDIAGMDMSPFYQYQLELMESVPVVASYNVFYDKEMNPSSFEEESELSGKVNTYLNMCFNNLGDDIFYPLFKADQN